MQIERGGGLNRAFQFSGTRREGAKDTKTDAKNGTGFLEILREALAPSRLRTERPWTWPGVQRFAGESNCRVLAWASEGASVGALARPVARFWCAIFLTVARLMNLPGQSVALVSP